MPLWLLSLMLFILKYYIFFFWQGDMITVLKQDPSGWWQVCQCVVCVCVLVGVVLPDFEWAE